MSRHEAPVHLFEFLLVSLQHHPNRAATISVRTKRNVSRTTMVLNSGDFHRGSADSGSETARRWCRRRCCFSSQKGSPPIYGISVSAPIIFQCHRFVQNDILGSISLLNRRAAEAGNLDPSQPGGQAAYFGVRTRDSWLDMRFCLIQFSSCFEGKCACSP